MGQPGRKTVHIHICFPLVGNTYNASFLGYNFMV